HFGRFTGTAVAKGHLKEGQPFYYIVQLFIYGMPWSPLFLFWFASESIKAVKNRIVTWEAFFLFVWGAGSVLLLSIPATKRGIYLLPALPAFAIMASLGLQAFELKTFYQKWLKRYAILWISLCVVLICIIAALPVITGFASDRIPEKAVKVLSMPGYFNWVISFGSLFVLITILYGYKNQFSAQCKIVMATAMVFIAFLGLPFKAIDSVKSMEVDIQHFVSSIPKETLNSIAGTNFSETMLGSIYYYTGWKVPQIDDQTRIQFILEGRDKEYSSVLINKRKVRQKETDLSEFEYTIIDSMVTGRNRGLFLIKGGNDNG
ncbi:MAG: hypothetical protein KAR45_14165, partial [Desulfobacteraceae bacterium]|nr:hypothetical protein [Desulfobacteraceae bacterium]